MSILLWQYLCYICLFVIVFFRWSTPPYAEVYLAQHSITRVAATQTYAISCQDLTPGSQVLWHLCFPGSPLLLVRGFQAGNGGWGEGGGNNYQLPWIEKWSWREDWGGGWGYLFRGKPQHLPSSNLIAALCLGSIR